MADQVRLQAEPRDGLGKNASGRLRAQGRVPAILYGYEVEPTTLHVDALELYHAMRTEAGSNALIRLEEGGETHLTVVRDIQRHPVKGSWLHVDFLAVDRDSQISVEVPVHLVDEDEAADDNGVLNQILYTVPILVKPLDVPNYFELSMEGLEIGDVLRVADIAPQLPEGAEFDIEEERTVVTVNAPISEEELEALEETAETDEDIAEGEPAGEPDEPAEESTEDEA